MTRKKLRKICSKIEIHTLLIIASIIMLLPFIWMVTTSFKDEADIFVTPPKFVGIR